LHIRKGGWENISGREPTEEQKTTVKEKLHNEMNALNALVNSCQALMVVVENEIKKVEYWK
jgi:hypothetical protein